MKLLSFTDTAVQSYQHCHIVIVIQGTIITQGTIAHKRSVVAVLLLLGDVVLRRLSKCTQVFNNERTIRYRSFR